MNKKTKEKVDSINDAISKTLGKKVEFFLNNGQQIRGVVEEITYFEDAKDLAKSPRLVIVNGVDSYFYYIDACRISVVSSDEKL